MTYSRRVQNSKRVGALSSRLQGQNKKSSKLPILKNDTNNVIEFNDGFSNEIKNDKPRSFWNLLKFK